MKQTLLTILLIFLPLLANADAVEINGINYILIKKGNVAEVTGKSNGYIGNVIIPETIEYDGTEYSVTSIGESAFWCSYNLANVTIPNSVTDIKDKAFQFCSNLSSVTIGNSVKIIGNYAFDGCSCLTTFTIPNSVITIGDYAFSGCTGLTAITIPGSVKSIGENIMRFNALDSLCVEKSNTIFDSRNNCNAIIETSTNTLISGCKKTTIPNSVNVIGTYAFSDCKGLAYVNIPNSVKTIGWGAFLGCYDLMTVIIGNNVTKIETYAFQACDNLTKLSIGSGVTNIYQHAFAQCPELTDVYCYAENVPNLLDSKGRPRLDVFEGSFIEYAKLHVPESSIDAYKSKEPWKNFKEIVKIMPLFSLSYFLDNEMYKSYPVEEGSTITPEAEPTKEGYTFSGWSETPETMPAHDVTVTGTFSINKYKLTYTVDGAEYKTYEVEYGATITPEVEPTKEGYTFSGWSEIPTTMPANDVTITGAFTINKYKLIYMIDNEEYKSYDVEYNSAITAEETPTKEGYTFSGWSEILETMPANDVIITGTFTINKYKLIYMVDGEEYKSYEIEYNSTITPEEEPTKEGYTFSGWNEVPETMPANDVTVTGTFTKGAYKLTYIVDGEVYKTISYDYGATITPEAAPTKEGYTFSGWSEIPETMPSEDVTITGSFTINKYMLTYYVDSEVYESYEVEYGASITPEAEPTKEGYTFSGWSEIPETMPAHDVTVTGTFTINKYKLTYIVDGVEYKSYKIEFGATITPEAEPTKEGFSFSGWSNIPSTMPANDVTITGSFTKGAYKLTYMVDGEVYKTISYDYGATITPEAAPIKEGHTFSGWSEIPETMPAHDVTITGTFSINSYKLTYMIDDEVYKEVTYEYGATITPEPQPEGDYDTFEWTDLPQTMPAHDVVVHANYTTGIVEILMSSHRNVRIYSPNGKKRDKIQKGLNIVVFDDSTVHKIWMK